jgi:anti-anti-sigma factor
VLLNTSVPFKATESAPGRLELVGELDLAGVGDLRACLERPVGDIVIDCSGLTFVDCAGIGPLVAAHQACEARGMKLVLCRPPACMTRLLQLTELDAVFNVFLDGSGL